MTKWRLKLFGCVVVLAIVFFLHVTLLRFSQTVYHGALETIVCIGQVKKLDTNESVDQIATFQILSSRFRGQTVEVDNIWIGRDYSDRKLYIGDRLFLEIPLRRSDQKSIDTVRLLEYFRTPYLLYLTGLLAVLMIIIGGSKGIRAIATMFLSGLIVFYLLIPLLVKGYNPIFVSLSISALLTLMTFVVIAGFSRKVISGVIGTLGGLIMVAVLSIIGQRAMYLTGLAEEFGFLELGIALWRTPGAHSWNFTDLLSAGMILGSVGAMMDVGMSISSSVHEVKEVNPNVSVRQAIRIGFNVGRDVMGTMADTLIFAYLGAEIITMLLPRIDFPEVGVSYPFLRIVNDEATAAAILQAIIGTIGLVLTVPITSVVAGILTKYAKVDRDRVAQDIPSTEELEMMHRQEEEKKSQYLVPFGLVVVICSILGLQNYVNHSAATVVREEDSSGNLVSVSEYAKGKVIRRLERNAETESTAHDILEIELLAGTYKGQNLILRNVIQKKMPLLTIPAEPGDIVLCRVGGSPDQIGLVNLVQEYGRDRFLIWMFGVMLVVIILVGRNEGVRTVIAMVGSGLIIYFFMLPLIAGGNPPVLIVVLSSGMIAFCSLVFVIGPSRKTLSAVISTMVGVTIAGFIVVISQHYLHFSGMENAISADIVEAVGIPFDFRQLLLAGMLIGLLGVAVDGAIEVSSSMEEVRRAHPQMPSWQLISSGMNVGTDILGTMVNTLLFAYIGVRILLLMAILAPDLRSSLFASPVVELLSIGITSAEILRLLAGTLGLVLVIPITAIISAFWHRRS